MSQYKKHYSLFPSWKLTFTRKEYSQRIDMHLCKFGKLRISSTSSYRICLGRCFFKTYLPYTVESCWQQFYPVVTMNTQCTLGHCFQENHQVCSCEPLAIVSSPDQSIILFLLKDTLFSLYCWFISIKPDSQQQYNFTPEKLYQGHFFRNILHSFLGLGSLDSTLPLHMEAILNSKVINKKARM